VMADWPAIIMQVYALESALLRARKLARFRQWLREGCFEYDRLVGGRDHGFGRAGGAACCWRLAARATCYGTHCPFCAVWQSSHRPMWWD